MRLLKELLKCAALVCLCAALLAFAALLLRLPKIVNQQADKTRTELLAETDAALLTFDGRLGDANQRIIDALALLDRRSGQALGEVHAVSANADARTGEALDIVRGIAENANEQASTLNANVAATLKPVTETAQQVDDALPLFADCEFNPDCAFNRFQGVSKAVEQTAQTIAKEAPNMTASVDAIATSAAGVASSADATGKEIAIAAKRFNAPQTKLQALRSWMLTVARIYGAL